MKNKVFLKDDKLFHPTFGSVIMVEYGSAKSLVKIFTGEIKSIFTKKLSETEIPKTIYHSRNPEKSNARRIRNEEIKKLYAEGKSHKFISKKFNMSKQHIRQIIKSMGVVLIDERKGKVRAKTKRNEKIKDLLLQEKSYDFIAKRFKITKQRVQQIGKTFSLGNKWVHSRIKKEALKTAILESYNNGMSFSSLKENFGKNNVRLIRLADNSSIFRDSLINRNDLIVGKFIFGDIAKEIVESKEKELKEPQKINHFNSVYKINSKYGILRYPMLKYKNRGGFFETKEVSSFIKDMRDTKNWPFSKITEELNLRGYKTITGKAFSIQNVYCKYNRIKTEDNVRKQFGFKD